MDDNMVSVPYVIHEGMQVRSERTIKRLVYALILTILLMFASNGLWLYAWMQYDYTSEDSTTTTTTMNKNTVDVNSGLNGVATYVGDIVNGTDHRDNNSDNNDSNEKEAQETTAERWEEQGNP